jgi:penicillin-binding protein 1C
VKENDKTEKPEESMRKKLEKRKFKSFIRLLRRKKGYWFAAFFLGLVLFWRSLPSSLFNTPYSTVVLDRNGELIGASIAADGQWRFPPVEEVPEKFIRSITIYEDRYFFHHPGVDISAVARALWSNIRSQRIVSGASTLTMQVIRLSRNKHSRTLLEKLAEMVLALRLELSKSKKEIMALYASHAPFGGNVVGLEAAAWRYFGRRPDQLSWAETAMLAVLPNSPALIHPGKGREVLRLKRDLLLDKLERHGIIDSVTCSLAKIEKLPPKPHSLPMLVPHLHGRIKKELSAQAKGMKKGPRLSRIRTTIDKDLQARATEIIRRHYRQLSGNGIHNAAALVLDVENKQVLSYVGNIPNLSDSEHGNHVDIITAPRSTGSILKPFLYAAMLDAGEMLPHELVPDIPTQIGSFMPQNFTKTYQGAVPAHMALARSMNIPAVRMLNSFGLDRFYALLKKLGMNTLHRPAQDYGLTLILGGAEGTLWDITGIYAGMAHCVNRYFRIHKLEGSSFFSPNYIWVTPEKQKAYMEEDLEPVSFTSDDGLLGPASCWLTLEAMLEVTRPDEDSAWRNFASSRKIAWKTGTSYGLRDGWAVGVTPRYAVGVWTGNADGEGRPGLTGIATAAPILFEIFGILDYQDWFDVPEAQLAEIEVCVKSGHRAGPYCEGTRKVLVPLSGLRTQPCPYCRVVHCDANLTWRVHSECERIASIRAVNWFVLPPVWEWYYKKRHSDYRSLPPFRNDCIESIDRSGALSLSLIYPRRNGLIYIPVELDGRRGRTVFEAAHRNARATIYWHLDDEFLGATKDIHRIALAPKPGLHTVTLVDENGERLERRFVVLSKDTD